MRAPIAADRLEVVRVEEGIANRRPRASKVKPKGSASARRAAPSRANRARSGRPGRAVRHGAVVPRPLTSVHAIELRARARRANDGAPPYVISSHVPYPVASRGRSPRLAVLRPRRDPPIPLAMQEHLWCWTPLRTGVAAAAAAAGTAGARVRSGAARRAAPRCSASGTAAANTAAAAAGRAAKHGLHVRRVHIAQQVGHALLRAWLRMNE